MIHAKQPIIAAWLAAKEPVLLEGPAGTGKTTIAINLAKEAGKKLCMISGTKQTTVNALLGFISINGTYIPTQFRDAYEKGHYFLIDEIDAMDPNVLLAINTIENGLVSFPDGVVAVHPDFRLLATANPTDSHSQYTGRSKLDFSTLDRFQRELIEIDPDLEAHISSSTTTELVATARSIIEANATTKQLTSRDARRMAKCIEHDIAPCPVKAVVFQTDAHLYTEYTDLTASKKAQAEADNKTQTNATSEDDAWELIQAGR